MLVKFYKNVQMWPHLYTMNPTEDDNFHLHLLKTVYFYTSPRRAFW